MTRPTRRRKRSAPDWRSSSCLPIGAESSAACSPRRAAPRQVGMQRERTQAQESAETAHGGGAEIGIGAELVDEPTEGGEGEDRDDVANRRGETLRLRRDRQMARLVDEDDQADISESEGAELQRL